jgi:hypothetical protein
MDALFSVGDEILFIEDPPNPERRPRRFWRVARWAFAITGVAVIAGAFVPAAIQYDRAARRMQCHQQLRELGVAMSAYHEQYGHFPAPALMRKDGVPLLSWRVAILPYLGYESLYQRFHLDEPWDSPHNRALIAEMPSEYACPSGGARWDGQTGYLVVVGPKTEPTSVNTPFEPTRGVENREITDGTSNTILVLESDTLVPWTKPDDLRWEKGEPLPTLSTRHPYGEHVLLADGATRFLKLNAAPDTLLAILTINGGEVIDGPG